MHITPNYEAVGGLIAQDIQGPVVMLNLLRFRAKADYIATPELTPLAPISGADAYRQYMAHTTPYLTQAGGELVFIGKGNALVIGPQDERWDLCLLIRHLSVDAFLSFASNEGYLEGVGHRTAALADSRLMPMLEGQFRA